MRIYDGIHPEVLIAACDLLRRKVPELTPTTLVKAIQQFSTGEKAATPPPSVLLSITEVADRLRVSRPTIHKMIENGELSCVRIGKKTMFKEETLEDFQTTHTFCASQAKEMSNVKQEH